ncbi:hypothetical protein L1D44_11165 [Shewanella sp. Isolate13]|uniref:sugar phosphate nucleotidyltransferase n=1 Tax=Shewanella sp. Isolate13 TaxID=2908531 RepID=UPI001EFC7DDF|nr:sugar phosphate nucleotidyltransferase [Shewanella sp. Isolate13]MCG9730404.1 hypothetical protein [Shewanella sp. Isolate13]
MKGMILATGKGTPIKPISYAIPKPMVAILGKTMMGHYGYTQLIADCQYVHILKNRNVSRPLSSIASMDKIYMSTPIPHDTLTPLEQAK